MRLKLKFNDGWALVPGPDKLNGKMNTSNVHDVADYSVKEIERYVLKFPGLIVTHDTKPDYQRWTARINSALGELSLRMALHDEETFGGFFVYSSFDRQLLLDFWNYIRIEFPAIWLFTPDDQHIYSPEAAVVGPIA
jgi:hypothetical protein